MYLDPTQSQTRRRPARHASGDRPTLPASFPTYGRFLEADPLGYEDGLNMYAYVGNDPVNFTDPIRAVKGICG